MKTSRYTDLDGNQSEATIEAEIVKQQGIGPAEKLIYFQTMRFIDGHLEYRFTYFIRSRKGKRQGQWVFGRNPLVLPPDDLAWLLSQARDKGWEGFGSTGL